MWIQFTIIFVLLFAGGLLFFKKQSQNTLSLQSSISVLFLFFTGVYFGKVFTLYLYSKCSLLIKNKVHNISLVINKVTGVLLVLIGLTNAIRENQFFTKPSVTRRRQIQKASYIQGLRDAENV